MNIDGKRPIESKAHRPGWYLRRIAGHVDFDGNAAPRRQAGDFRQPEDPSDGLATCFWPVPADMYDAANLRGSPSVELFGKNLKKDVVVIAEIGVNHEGDVETALRLVRAAAEAGADAVKFQSYTPERYLSAATDPERLARIARFALDEEAHRRLAAEAAACGIAFCSTPVSEDWLPLIAELSPAIKIASGDLTFEPLIRAAARTGKPTVMSVGAGTIEEIDRAVAWFADEVGHDALAERLALLHCVVSYPTPIEEANVLSVPFLRQRYGLEVGYSNHVIGPEACYASVALGGSIVEIHFTDCKTGRTFRDHALSYEPDDLRHLVATLTRIKSSLGRFGKERSACEAGNVQGFRKGIAATRDLPAGHVVSLEDLHYCRPIVDFSSMDLDVVVGRTIAREVHKGMPICRSDLADV